MMTSQIEYRDIQVSIPEIATKQLKIQHIGGKRRVTLSSNWLMLFGMEGDIVEESLGKGKGIKVRLANDSDIEAGKTKKVYTREYRSRSANPLNPVARRKERLIQIASQKLIDDSLGNATHVHITFSYGEVTFTPVSEQQYAALKELDPEKQISALVAMTGGVDCHVLEKSGFRIDTVIEYRPNEKRDTADYTEMTALSALVNSNPKHLINEDIYTLDYKRLGKLLSNSDITVGHFSLQCDEYSTLKTHEQREQSVQDMSSTLDMFIPMLDIIDNVNLPVVMIENVPGFMSSPIYDVVRLQLQRRGYKVHGDVFNATEHGGLTTRKRFYMVATTLDSEFMFPSVEENESNAWLEAVAPYWDEVIEKDVTETKVVKDSIKTGRARVITEEKQFAPTLTKSQGNDAKDSVVVEKDGRYYRLPVSVQKALNKIPNSFDLSWSPLDKAAQIIGQSICCSLHERIMRSVEKHIRQAQMNAIIA